MKTIEINLYKFDELSPFAKQTAIKAERDSINYLDYEWYEHVYADFTEYLEGLGYMDPKLAFSGFCSQGDGASFTAKMSLKKWIGNDLKFASLLPLIEEGLLTAEIRRGASNYSHENTCSACVLPDLREVSGEAVDLCDTLESALEADRYRLCKELYKQLEDEYEHLSSDETLAENLAANDFDFTEDGKLYL